MLKAREDGFTLGDVSKVKLTSYNALYDPNMRHYFENKHVQSLLYSTGQIDRHGRVIDLRKNAGKLAILDREFKEAEKVEERRYKEEMEMRYRVQRKRFAELERTRKEMILHKLKADHELSKDILNTMRGTTGAATSHTAKSSPGKGKNRGNMSMEDGSFFVTDS